MLHCLWLETVTDIKHLPTHRKMCQNEPSSSFCTDIIYSRKSTWLWIGGRVTTCWYSVKKQHGWACFVALYTTVQLTISCYWETYILGTILPVVLSVFAAPTQTVPNEATEESKEVSEQLGTGVQFLNQRSENRLNKWFIDSVKCKLV